MAIITISQILNRAGLQENLPQLAGGELGWCFDTQKLYVGNGATADGAPAIGNTEILTEHSNVLQLANLYDFKNTSAGYVPETGSGNSQFNQVSYGFSKHIAVGADGLLATSTDANTWNIVATGVPADLNDIVPGIVRPIVSGTPTPTNGMIAVGNNGTILVSTDGTSWQQVTTSFTVNLKAVAYGNSHFVAVSDNGYTAVSSDGYNWTLVNTGASVPLRDIVFGDNLWVTVGVNGKTAHSTDLATWTLNSAVTVAGSPVNFESVAYNGMYVATAEGKMFVSLNGAQWALTFIDAIHSVAYGGLTYVAAGDDGLIWTSTNATAWTSTSVSDYNLRKVVFANSMFVAAGDHGRLYTSPDGTNWTTRSTGTISNLYGLVWNGTLWVAVGEHGTIITSSDAVTWTAQVSGTTNDLEDVCMHGTTIIAVGRGGTALKSTDATAWTSVATGVSANLWGVTSDGTTIVTVGDAGTILTGDASTWVLQTSGVTASLYSVATSGTSFVAVGQAGTTLKSTDGAAWTAMTSNTVSTMLGVDFVNNLYVATGNNDTIARTSTTVWTVVQGVTAAAAAPVFYSIAPMPDGENTLFVAVGENGRVATTTDGASWVSKPTGLFQTLNGVNVVPGYLIVAVGNGSQVATSADSETWTGFGVSAGQSVTSRSLQTKLDDIVSVKDFGAKGDGTTDDSEAINRALRELFVTAPNEAGRKALYFPAGVYAVGSLIKIPTGAFLFGEGAFASVIKSITDPNVTGLYYVATTADNLQQSGAQLGMNGAAMPSNIALRDIGIAAKANGLLVQSASNVTLDRVAVTGSYTTPTADLDPQWNLSTTGVEVIGATLAPASSVTIRKCYVDKFSSAVESDSTSSVVERITVTDSVFKNLYRGLDLAPTTGSVKSATLSNNHFDSVYAEGVRTGTGINVISSFNVFNEVGNALNGDANPITPVVSFGAGSVGCLSIGDSFGRANAVSGSAKTAMWDLGSKLKLGTYFVTNGNSATFTSSTTTAIHTYSQAERGGIQVDYSAISGTNVKTGSFILSCNSAGTIVTDDRFAQVGNVGVTMSGAYSSGNVTVSVTTSGSDVDFSYAVKYFGNVV